MFGGIAAFVMFALHVRSACLATKERERSQSNILRGGCHQYLAERDKMQVQTVVL